MCFQCWGDCDFDSNAVDQSWDADNSLAIEYYYCLGTSGFDVGMTERVTAVEVDADADLKIVAGCWGTVGSFVHSEIQRMWYYTSAFQQHSQYWDQHN